MRAFRTTEIFGNSGCYHGVHLYLFFTLTDRAISAMVPLIVPPLDHVGQNLPAEPTTCKALRLESPLLGKVVGTEASPPTHTEEKSAVEKRGWQSLHTRFTQRRQGPPALRDCPAGCHMPAPVPNSPTPMIQGTLKQALGVTESGRVNGSSVCSCSPGTEDERRSHFRNYPWPATEVRLPLRQGLDAGART